MLYVIYIAAVCGALAVYLTLPHRRSMGKLGGLLGVATLGLGLGWITQWYRQHSGGDLPGVYYFIFTFIALASAVRVITHQKPVYAALYFILVVLSTAGMLVLLDAEFMSFAMVIIYGGAILVTYMFVIMLATMPQGAGDPETSPIYDREAREPLLAVSMGFAMLAVIGSILFNPATQDKPIARDYPANLSATLAEMKKLSDLSDPKQRRYVQTVLRDLNVISLDEKVYGLDFEKGEIDVRTAEGVKPRIVDMTKPFAEGEKVALKEKVLAGLIPNIDQVGLNLFKGHTLGIELAAVILLLSMVGAIVIAKRSVPESKPEHTY